MNAEHNPDTFGREGMPDTRKIWEIEDGCARTEMASVIQHRQKALLYGPYFQENLPDRFIAVGDGQYHRKRTSGT